MMNAIFEAAGLQVFERGWLSSNNVLFDGAGRYETVLVDSGYCTHAPQTLALVRQALGVESLDRIVNTHLHSDHCGGNHALQQAFGCQIDVPLGEMDKVDRWDECSLTYRDTGQQCPRFERTGAIRGDDEIQLGAERWRAIAAPGHDPESIVLYQPELKLLISADALWENGFGVVFPELEGMAAFDEVRSTLNTLASLQVKWIIPGHGAPFQGLDGAVARARRRLDGFISNPARHSRYAAKVLIKFHFLECQRQTQEELIEWFGATRFMQLAHATHFASVNFRAWCLELVGELAASRAIAMADGSITNI